MDDNKVRDILKKFGVEGEGATISKTAVTDELLKIGVPGKKALASFDEADLDGDDKLDYAELLLWVESGSEEAAALSTGQLVRAAGPLDERLELGCGEVARHQTTGTDTSSLPAPTSSAQPPSEEPSIQHLLQQLQDMPREEAIAALQEKGGTFDEAVGWLRERHAALLAKEVDVVEKHMPAEAGPSILAGMPCMYDGIDAIFSDAALEASDRVAEKLATQFPSLSQFVTDNPHIETCEEFSELYQEDPCRAIMLLVEMDCDLLLTCNGTSRWVRKDSQAVDPSVC